MKFSEYISTIKDKRITVIGIGVSNLPLLYELLDNGCQVVACDKTTEQALGETASELKKRGAVLRLGPDYLKDLDGDIIFRTPGMRPDLAELESARKRGSIITSEMEVFFSVCPCKIIAVTGSDGKTTTTSIIAALLKTAGYTVHVGGNIGTPLLCKADSMRSEDIVVLELSSFQLMTMKASPSIAVITNLAPNHLDVHKNMAEYIQAKKNIYYYQNEEDLLVLNADNEITNSFINEAKGNVRTFSCKKEVEDGFFFADGQIFKVKNGKKLFILNSKNILLPGMHNVENYMAAFAAVDSFINQDIMRNVSETFGGVEHRIELVRTLHGVRYYNDSIASSPSRTIAGLHSFDKKVILIAGGKDKGVPFDELGEEIIQHVKTLILTGFTAQRIYQAVVNASGYEKNKPKIIITEEFQDAVTEAAKHGTDGDIVILSPACTSFDRFKNFAERGRVFKEIVNNLE